MGTSKKMTAAERRVIDLIKSRPGIEFHQGGRWTKKTHVDIFDDDDGLPKLAPSIRSPQPSRTTLPDTLPQFNPLTARRCLSGRRTP